MWGIEACWLSLFFAGLSWFKLVLCCFAFSAVWVALPVLETFKTPKQIILIRVGKNERYVFLYAYFLILSVMKIML